MRWLVTLGTVALLLSACDASTTATPTVATAAPIDSSPAPAATQGAGASPTERSTAPPTAGATTGPSAEATTGPSAEASPVTTASPVPASGGASSIRLIDLAVAAGRIDAGTALLYRTFALFDDPRLPGEFGSATPIPDGTEIAVEAVTGYPRLAPGLQAQLGPFLVPPYYQGSWWSNRSAATAALAGALGPIGAAQPQCVPLDLSQDDCPESEDWRSIDTRSGKARIWYQVRYPRDAVRAANLADEIDAIVWPGLAGLMGREPISDRRHRNDGGSGAIDIALVDLATTDGLAFPYGDCGDGIAAHLMIDRSPSRPIEVIAVHELMHALQFSYALARSCGEYGWLREATATWAEDHIYPTLDAEHVRARAYLATIETSLAARTAPPDAFGETVESREYGGYVFFQYLTRSHGTQLIRRIWEAAAGEDQLGAIDSTIPGKFAERWPEFALFAWNQADWRRFHEWDRLDATPSSRGYARTLFGEPQSVQDALEESLAPLAVRYETFEFEPEVSAIAWYNGLLFNLKQETFEPTGSLFTIGANSPDDTQGLAIQALILTEDGRWRREVWTNLPQVTICFDEPSQRVRELVLIYSDSDHRRQADFRIRGEPPSLMSSNIGCWRWTATIDDSLEGPGSRRLAIHGDVTFEAIPMLPGTMSWAIRYRVVSARVRWEASGVDAGCTYSGSGDVAIDGPASDFTTFTFVVEGKGRRAYAGALRFRDPPPEYAIQCGSDPAERHAIGYGLYAPVSSELVAVPADGRVIDGEYVDARSGSGTIRIRWHLEAQRE